MSVHPSFIATCTSTAFLITHLNGSDSFITGHSTCTFSSFHLIWFLRSIDRMTTGCFFLIGISISDKPFKLGSFNLLDVASQVWVVLFFQALLKYSPTPTPRVQWWWVFSWKQLWVFVSFYSANSLCEFIHTYSFPCHNYLLADPFSF